jgi:hypothetical protein
MGYQRVEKLSFTGNFIQKIFRNKSCQLDGLQGIHAHGGRIPQLKSGSKLVK